MNNVINEVELEKKVVVIEQAYLGIIYLKLELDQ